MNKSLRASSLLIIFLLAAGAAHAQVANFTGTPLSGCSPLVVNFTSTSTGTITGYSWTLGNTTSSTLQNPSTTYTTPGTYPVTLTVSGPGGTNTLTRTGYVIVYSPPVISFSYNNTSGCAPFGVQFTSSVTPNATGTIIYNWDFGDGTYATSANPLHSYAAAGTYSVTLTVTNSHGCSSSVTQTSIITVYPLPTGTFSGFPTFNCQVPATVAFTNSAVGTGPFSVTWNFGDGSIAGAGNNPSHTYTAAGVFTVSMYVTDAHGCMDSVVQPAYVTTHANNASFTAPASICSGATATFANTTSGGGTTTWDFGDGSPVVMGSTVTHTYTLPIPSTASVSYSVRMVTNVGGCNDTAIQTIVVNPKPVINVTKNPYYNCPAPISIQYSATGASSYQWHWSESGHTATGSNQTEAYVRTGFADTVTVIGTSAFGCVDTVKTAFPIYSLNVVVHSLIHGCAPFTMTVDSAEAFLSIPSVIYGVNITSYFWDFGDGSTSTAIAPTHIYYTAGTYNRVFTYTTSNGCTRSDTVVIHVGNKVHPSFTINPDTVCPHVPVYFTNTTPAWPGSTTTYTWEVGDSYTLVNNRDAVASYFIPHIYMIILYADSNGCVDSAVCDSCVVVRPANANFLDSIYCSTTTVQFINASVGATSYLWRFGDGYTSTSANPLHTYALTGSYNATLITTNNVYGCSDTMTQPISLQIPVLNLIASDTALCKGDTLHLTGSYTGPYAISYEYIIDDIDKDAKPTLAPVSSPANGPVTYNPHFIYNLTNVTGYHTVSFIVTRPNGGMSGICKDSIRKPNYIIVSKPTPAFGASPLTGCTPLSVTFTDSSVFTPGTASISRSWTFGDGGTTSNNNLSTTHIYTTGSIYSVKLIVTDWNGCADSITRAGYITALHPTAAFTANDVNACIGQPISFTNLSFGASALSYKWYFGDGDSSTVLGPVHSYRSTGSFTVRLIVTDTTGCTDTLVRAAYMSITRPTAAFTLSDTLAICPPLVVNFNSTAVNALTYAWNFGNTGTSVIANPVSTFSAPGVYTVQFVAIDAAGCTDTARANVRVLGYAGALSYTPLSGCSPLTVLFSANISNVPALVWDFSDGTTLATSSRSASHTYLNPGAYLPKLLFSDSSIGCSSSSTGIDTIKVDGVIAGFKALPPCEKTITQLIDTSTSFFSPINYTLSRWDFGPAGIATGSPVQRLYPAAGTYSITLISTNTRGCRDTLTRDITIFPLPHVLAPPDTAVCIPDAIALSASGALSYTWSPGATLSCTACTSTVAAPTAPTLYIVTGTDTNGCANRDTVRVGIQTKSTFVTTASGEICLGQHFQLIAAGATLYSWSPAATLDNADAASPIATPTVNTTYIVTGREGSCLADTHSVHVVVRPLPVVDAGGDLKVVAGNFILLQASGSGITRVEWGADASLSCLTCYAPEARPKVSSVYRITAYNEYGCSSTDSVRVVVLCDGSQLFIPNTFTPNGDGLNDMFYARGQGIDHINSMRVYSRWGELMYEGTNLQVNDERSGWNGTHGGRILNPDVYVYVIEATCDTGEPIKFKGDITLIR